MYEYSYDLLCRAIEGITHEQSLAKSAGSSNPANWILGHIITSRCNVLAMLDLPPVWELSRCQPYLPGSEPLPEQGKIELFENMAAALNKTQEMLLEAFDNITDQGLLKLAEGQTIGEQLAGYGIHEAYHAGELAAGQTSDLT